MTETQPKTSLPPTTPLPPEVKSRVPAELRTGGQIRPITRWGEAVMHAPTRPVTQFDDELHTLIRDMFATMAAAEGVGLAATQVGVDLSVFVYDCPDDHDVRHIGIVCNPKVTLPEGKDRVLDTAEEGCLSYPGAFVDLARPDLATCTGQDETGAPVEITGTGLFARCLQHETDHLNGTVFGDRLPSRSRKKLTAQHQQNAEFYPANWPLERGAEDPHRLRRSSAPADEYEPSTAPS